MKAGKVNTLWIENNNNNLSVAYNEFYLLDKIALILHFHALLPMQ